MGCGVLDNIYNLELNEDTAKLSQVLGSRVEGKRVHYSIHEHSNPVYTCFRCRQHFIAADTIITTTFTWLANWEHTLKLVEGTKDWGNILIAQ